MQRKVIALMGLLVLTAGMIRPAVAADSEVVNVGTLALDGTLFWDGYVEDSVGNPQSPDPDICDAPTMDCKYYSFEVVEPADRLRVALSDPSATEIFGLDVFAPDGTRVATGGGVTWDVEKFVTDPTVGTWTVRVRPTSVEDSPFRLRARLENLDDEVRHEKPGKDMLPNLRLTPPFEFTFEAPASLLGPGVGVAGKAPVSCSPRETIDWQDVRCLRFSMGPQNVGDGLLEVHYEPTASPYEPVPVTQMIQQTDGTPRPVSGGYAQYHASHAHYHHEGFGAVEIYRVTDEKKGDTELVGASPKQGYCIAPYLIVDWMSFDNEPVKRSTCETRGYDAVPSEGAVMYLSKGWSDVYAWAIDNNYVDFGTNGDGLYVVKSEADPDDLILETNETDNSCYALISIEGDSIQVLERGYGEDPWDNHKILAEDSLLYDNADTKWVPFSDLT